MKKAFFEKMNDTSLRKCLCCTKVTSDVLKFMDPKDLCQVWEKSKCYVSFQLSEQTRLFWAVLKISAILLKYPTFKDVFFHVFMDKTTSKLELLQ